MSNECALQNQPNYNDSVRFYGVIGAPFRNWFAATHKRFVTWRTFSLVSHRTGRFKQFGGGTEWRRATDR